MIDFSQVQSLSDRTYYGPSIGRGQKVDPPWLTQESTPFYKDQSSLGIASLVAAGVIGSGFIPTKDGNMWNKYVRGLRVMEEYSPARMMRTFQLSNFFSQFSKSKEFVEGFHISGEQLQDNKWYRDYLYKLDLEGGPSSFKRLQSEGVTLKNGSLYFGKDFSEKGIALRYASGFIVPDESASHLGSSYARGVGATNFPKEMRKHSFFGRATPFHPESRKAGILNPFITGTQGEKFPVQVVGAKTRLEYGWRMAKAWGTEWVSRFNRLLEAPFEMEPFKTVFSKVQKTVQNVTEKYLYSPKSIKFAVEEGTGLQMLGRLSKKYGLGLGAIGLGYNTVDYLFRDSTLFDNTLLEEGITPAIATLGIKANLAVSKLAEVTGLHSYREAQENIAPGSTSLQKLIAFPLIGIMGANFAMYGDRMYQQAKLQRVEGISAAEAGNRIIKAAKEFGDTGWKAKVGTALTKQEGWYSQGGLRGKAIRFLTTPKEGGELAYKLLGKMGPAKLFTTLGAAAGLALTLPFLPGALIPSQRPEELEAIYSGEKEIAIRKGRWWEFGRSAYEGSRISHFRPHWYPRMLQRSKDKSIWGEDEPSPISKWFRKEFTYELEDKFSKDRPYPISSLPFEDIPLIGPLLANTIGKVIKPPVLMHTEEWVGPGGEMRGMPPRFGGRVATEMGELPGGKPITPYGIEGAIGEQAYRMTEMAGLPGFALSSIKDAITGTPEFFDQKPQLESARNIAGFEREYWDLEAGGLLGTTEAFRRLFPHKRRQIPLYNPIENTMPDWLPGPGEKSPDFRHGDPFTKVTEGELRLPGVGYAQRFRELEGVDPADYPLIHRYKILADIAPYSEQYGKHVNMIRSARSKGSWTEYEEEIYQTTKEQIKEKKNKLEFQEYQYLSPTGEVFGKRQNKWGGDQSSGLIAELNKISASQKEGSSGILRNLVGGYWELLSHNAETAWDSLTPMAPAAKLVHQRTAIESYKTTQVYGSQNAFWQHPLRDFLRPFVNTAKESFGFDAIPEHIQNRRAIEEKFDVLKYVKAARLANIARGENDPEAIKEFESQKDQTLFGINPFTRNYTSLFRALPRRDRDYLNAFSDAGTPEERNQILKLIPENERALYVARWKLAMVDDMKKAEKAGVLSESAKAESKEIRNQIYDESKSEGFLTSKELYEEYLATKQRGESYADWYRRTKLLPERGALPGPDWVGWHPSVDLEDVKLKVVQQIGEDMHDYDLWAERAQNLVNKPYINEEAAREVMQSPDLTPEQIRGRINSLLGDSGMRGDVFIRTSYSPVDQSEIEVNIEQD